MNLHNLTKPEPMDDRGFWRTSSGDEIPVEELTDNHIRNIIRNFGIVSVRSRTRERNEMVRGVIGEARYRQLIT